METESIDYCPICSVKLPVRLLDFGYQPVCNRFSQSSHEKENLFRMILGYCEICALLQLTSRPSASSLIPRYNWITYNEPEAHLDKMVQTIIDLPRIQTNSSFQGISFKDDSTLARLRNRGFKKSERISTEKNKETLSENIGVESVQNQIIPEKATAIVRNHGQADVVIARHIFEHTHAPQQFLIALREIIKPGGYLILEVPDCQKGIEENDFNIIWEEHTLYFTETSLGKSLQTNGFQIVTILRYDYPIENSLVAIATPSHIGNQPSLADNDSIQSEVAMINNFLESLPGTMSTIRDRLYELATLKGKLAIFGAGHHTCKYINLLQIKDIIKFVVDDNPHKQGLFMAGSRLPVYSTHKLFEQETSVCLLGLSPESEHKVIQNNQEFMNRGGTFLSIFQPDRLISNS